MRFYLFASTLAGAFYATVSYAAINLSGPTTDWQAITYPGKVSDYVNDSQATDRDVEIVGDANHPAFYRQFDDGGSASLTDGELAFRFRLAGDKDSDGLFKGNAWVGLDVDGNADLDVFIGYRNANNQRSIGVYAAGTGANTSPSTTTIASTATYLNALTAQNLSSFRTWAPVTAVNDPTATNFNLDGKTQSGGNNTDHFLSFRIDFAEVVTAVNTIMGSGFSFNQNSAVSFVAATAKQGNTLNADLNAVNGGTNSSSTWASLGALSPTQAVPEPARYGLIGAIFSLGTALCFRRRRA